MKNELQNSEQARDEQLSLAVSALQPTKSVDDIRASLELTEFGKPRNTIQNCLTVFQQDEYLKGAICFNLLTERIDIVRPVGWERQIPQFTDTDMCYIHLYLESHYGLTSENKISHAIRIVANENKYHPICRYLSQLKWDGQERIRFALRHFLGADVNEYTYEAMKLFMLGAINRVYHAGCKFEYMLCFAGGQGAGKSTLFRLLAVNDEWFSDDLRRLDDENIYRKIQGHWILEMSEMLATGNAKSIEEIKAFLSKQMDSYKVPYDTHPQDRLRQCVFGGTSNALDFLPLDRTGNRRFIPIMVYPERAETHILSDEKYSREYIDQMWAEAMTIYRYRQYRLTLSKEISEYLKCLQKNFMPEDTKAGMIQAYLDDTQNFIVCSKQLFSEALKRGQEDPKQWEIREINDIMNNCVVGWRAFSNPRNFLTYGRQKGWERCDNRHIDSSDKKQGN